MGTILASFGGAKNYQGAPIFGSENCSCIASCCRSLLKHPKPAQEAPRLPQEAPKRPQDPPRPSLRSPQEAPRASQDASRLPEDRPDRSQNAPKTVSSPTSWIFSRANDIDELTQSQSSRCPAYSPGLWPRACQIMDITSFQLINPSTHPLIDSTHLPINQTINSSIQPINPSTHRSTQPINSTIQP